MLPRNSISNHMARNLNKRRVKDTALALFISFTLVIFSEQLLSDGTKIHTVLDVAGYFLIAICVVGRIYCTAFLGGYKNKGLITYGPFSVCQNPLYFCSFIGACGIALMSNHITLFVLVPLVFCGIFFSVIRREKQHLTQQFGDAYTSYCHDTPLFFPNIRRFHVPQTVTMHPHYLWNGVKDGLTWFIVPPAFELIEYIQYTGYIKTWFVLW